MLIENFYQAMISTVQQLSPFNMTEKFGKNNVQQYEDPDVQS